ncbi:MAG: hypothetical protein MPJ78_01515 [Hyphomicrobiaceae bacterium]|nr:hypothetical protein [Hyphomicrobiaceae bacterium]
MSAENIALGVNDARSEVPWKDISKAQLLADAAGEPIGVDVRSKSNQRLRLIGFENMPELVQALKSKTPSDAWVEDRRKWLDWRKPTTPFLAIGLPAIVIAFIVLSRSMGADTVRETVLALGCICAGIYSLWQKPISREDPSLANMEAIMGPLFLIVGALMLLTPFW